MTGDGLPLSVTTAGPDDTADVVALLSGESDSAVSPSRAIDLVQTARVLVARDQRDTATMVAAVASRVGAARVAEVCAIGVAPSDRRRGTGRMLLDALGSTPRIDLVVAETDDDAVEFYRACGFVVESLGERYPGVVRYRCSRPCA